jgi:hypothetical protein
MPETTLPPLGRKDLKPCAICGKGLMHTGLPLFWRVHVERIGVDAQAVQRQAGLETFFGGGHAGAVLADVMGDGAALAKPLDAPTVRLICESCATDKPTFIAILGSAV